MGLLAHRLIAANARLNAIALVTVVSFIVLGAWMYIGVKQSLQATRAAGLNTMLEAEANTLQLWVENRKTHVEHWSQDPRVRRHVAELIALSRGGKRAGDALWSSPARAALSAALEPVLRGAGAAGFNVVDTTGRLAAAQTREHHGRRIAAGSFLGHLREVFKGRPGSSGLTSTGTAWRTRQPAPPPGRSSGSQAPVTDEAGSVIAALGFSYPADGEFAKILSVARLGATGEAYVFDERGVMLSESRFVPELRKAGLVPQGAGRYCACRSAIPAATSARGTSLTLEWARAAAYAACRACDREPRQGGPRRTPGRSRWSPIRNYRGVPVIGAWKWLAEHGHGVGDRESARTRRTRRSPISISHSP